jgi:hypothetical protein
MDRGIRAAAARLRRHGALSASGMGGRVRVRRDTRRTGDSMRVRPRAAAAACGAARPHATCAMPPASYSLCHDSYLKPH